MGGDREEFTRKDRGPVRILVVVTEHVAYQVGTDSESKRH